MELDKSTFLQKQVRDNSEDLQSELLDLNNWEKMMKLKDQELLNKRNEQETLPPIRSKNKKESITEQNNITKNSKPTTLEKFDSGKDCNEAMEKSQTSDLWTSEPKEQLEKKRSKATEFKQKGNCFVQQKEWNKAIVSYDKAIEIFPYDATFYANRALCYLKQDNFRSAETDCSCAIQLDDTYVKAYHRRATARMRLNQFKEAKEDIEKVLKLEPSNRETQALLDQINEQLLNLKPTVSEKNIADDIPVEKKIAKKIFGDVKSNKNITDIKGNNDENNINIKSIVKPTTSTASEKTEPYIPDWLPEKNNVKIVKAVKKPSHLCSQEPFKRIPVQEADLTKPFKKEIKASCITIKDVKSSDVPSDNAIKCKENITKTESKSEENFVENYTEIPPIPKTSVQFYTNWRKYTSFDFRYKYLKQLPPGSLPEIFQDSMESNIFSDIILVLKKEFMTRQEHIFSYLKDFTNLRRFRTLIMFTTNLEKLDLKLMFSYSQVVEKISKEELEEVLIKYEI